MFKFPKSTNESLPYTGVYDANGKRWSFMGESFPSLIWCLANKKTKGKLKQLRQIQQK